MLQKTIYLVKNDLFVQMFLLGCAIGAGVGFIASHHFSFVNSAAIGGSVELIVFVGGLWTQGVRHP